MPSLRAAAAPSAAVSLPVFWSPSESRSTAAGGGGAPGLLLPTALDATSAEVATPSPSAVPENSAFVGSAFTISCRSYVGGTFTVERNEKITKAVRYLEGKSWRNCVIAASAAESRVGLTSLAAIEPETSSASTTVAPSRGTLNVACGLA